MKPSLRGQFFVWLMGLNALLYGMILTVFVAWEIREAKIEKTSIRHEAPEIFGGMLVAVATLPAMIVISWVVAGRLLHPLQQVLKTAEQIRQGDLSHRIPPLAAEDELARLADTINDAFDRYAMAVRRLENFSSDASHQLRTPLAAIRAAAEVTLQQERSAEEYRETLGDVLDQSEKLNQTIEQMLLLSRIDASLKQAFAGLALDRECRQWVEETLAMLDTRKIVFVSDPQNRSCEIRGNPVLLREVFNNLVNNALAVIAEDGTIRVSVFRAAGGVAEWRVEDSGPGVPAPERDRIFDRFYRGRAGTYSGSGLGLAVVKEIVSLHGGTVRVATSETLGGAAFIVCLPLSGSGVAEPLAASGS